jgi:DNA-binding response OmpR family regulator
MTIGVLVVEDDFASGAVYSSILDTAGYRVALATTMEAALAALDDDPGTCIVDRRLPGRADGIDFVRAARARLPKCRIVMVAADPIEGFRDEAIASGADVVFQKPVELADLLAVLPKPKGPEKLD